MKRQYPKGRIHANDDGQTRVKIAVDATTSRLIIEFETPTKWIGLDKESAVQLLFLLAKNTAQLTKEPIQIVLGDEIKNNVDS
jgi:hypothetical protein